MRATNMLVLMSDEHNPKFLGSAGHPFIATPNLDALAGLGTRFTAAYTTCPICVPARAAFASPLGISYDALISLMRSGDTYVNVHSDNGVAPANTGPGDFPGGEIRGQISLVP